MDLSGSFFSREFNILKQLAPFCPTAEKQGVVNFGEKIQYLVCSYEEAENVKNFGVGGVFENLESFFYSFNQLANVNIDRSFQQYLKDFFERNQIANLPEYSRDAIKESSDLDKIGDILNCLKSEITYLSNNDCFFKSEFCHGNMKPSNILINSGYFKFIDLHDGFMGNRFFDLCRFFMQLGMSLESQKHFISEFLKTQNQDFNHQQIQEYNTCYNAVIRCVAYQAIFDYLIEVYLYESSRPQKLLDAIDLFARNEESLKQIPSLQKHIGFLFKDILEPIIGNDKALPQKDKS
jgi:serine/threonine protein kinase